MAKLTSLNKASQRDEKQKIGLPPEEKSGRIPCITIWAIYRLVKRTDTPWSLWRMSIPVLVSDKWSYWISQENETMKLRGSSSAGD